MSEDQDWGQDGKEGGNNASPDQLEGEQTRGTGGERSATPGGGQPQGAGGGQADGYASGQQRAATENTESILDAIQRPTPMSYIKGIIASMGLVGALLGVGVYLVAAGGGRSLYPSIVQAFSGVSGIEAMIGFYHELTMAYIANELAIFLAFLMAPLFGFLVALKMDDTSQAKMGAAGVGVGVGTVVFTVVVVFAASFIVPSLSELMSIIETIDNTVPTTGMAGASEMMLESIDLGSIDTRNAVVNGVLTGIPAGLAAAGIVYIDDTFFE
jgi:hypothetical protein